MPHVDANIADPEVNYTRKGHPKPTNQEAPNALQVYVSRESLRFGRRLHANLRAYSGSLVGHVPAHRSRLSVPAMKMRSSRPNPAGARYQRLPQSDDGFIDLQFERPPRRIPYRAIGLATVLFLLGTALLTVGSLLLAGVYIDPQYSDRTWPVLLLGLLVFIPGGYHVFIAYNAWRGVKGYSFDDIPEYND
ncbi:hypothetical protein Bbelb_442530 [Branchiostoma belcheri]|nr:hypothetical protein Bbelb_442530 [Branchiostoma belcheri]